MYQFPVTYYEKNLLFTEKNDCSWACYKLIGFNYDFLSEDKQIAWLARLTRFIVNLGLEAKILIIPTVEDVSEHYDSLIESLSKEDELYEPAVIHARGTEHYLAEKAELMGINNDYEVYVISKIQKTNSLSNRLDELFRRPAKVLEEFFGVEKREILESEIRYFSNAELAFFKEQSKRISLEKTDEKTIQWLIKRMFRRGLSDSIKLRKNRDGSIWKPMSRETEKYGEKSIRPLKRDVLTLTEGQVVSKERHLEVLNSDGKTSYQSFLTLSHIPDGLAFPGGEWLLLLQDYPFATEVCIHINSIAYRESLRKIDGKRREIKSQIEYVAQSDSVPDELFEASESADGLEAELKTDRAPLLDVSVSFCVAADNEEEMTEHALFLKEQMEDLNFGVERPFTDQVKLFMEFIPGAGRYVKDYILPLPPQTLAGSMFAVSRSLGDKMGPYIGTTGPLQTNVFLWLARACLLNRSASAAFLGTLGGGKSFNANLLTYLNILYGGSALILDPKGERDSWKDDIPELRMFTSITTLSSSDEDIGKLDPFIIYRDNMNEAAELAQNIICELFKILPKDDEYTALIEAIDWTKESENPCMSTLAERLDNFEREDYLYETARRLARRIKTVRKSGMAKLLFGTGKEKGLSFDNRLNILQIQNLQMPERETPKEDYTQEELLSTVLMLPIAGFAKKFALSDRSIFKIVLFDESWALSSTQLGIKTMNFLARMGRSLNAGCIFIGHSVNDLKGEGIKNAITYKFCFKTTEINEVKRVLQFLDLEETDENIRVVMNLGNGQCLFQDLDGRVGKLQFDAVYEHLIYAFNTNPNKEKGSAADEE
ncbi:MAG: ATP-binding protein [Anaerovoracaceae bacterium]